MFILGKYMKYLWIANIRKFAFRCFSICWIVSRPNGCDKKTKQPYMFTFNINALKIMFFTAFYDCLRDKVVFLF